MEDNNFSNPDSIYRNVEKKEEPILVNSKVAFRDEIVSIKEWLSILVILSIPIINVVYVFVRVFFKAKKSKTNFFIAYLIYSAIVIVVLIVFGIFSYIYGVPIISNFKYIFG